MDYLPEQAPIGSLWRIKSDSASDLTPKGHQIKVVSHDKYNRSEPVIWMAVDEKGHRMSIGVLVVHYDRIT